VVIAGSNMSHPGMLPEETEENYENIHNSRKFEILG
jgi:hypothetical protein